jgi:hypothetical protein
MSCHILDAKKGSAKAGSLSETRYRRKKKRRRRRTNRKLRMLVILA